MRSLFKAIQGIVELINEILIREKVTWYLFNINCSSEGSIEKGSFYVEMVNVETGVDSKGEENSDGGHFDDRCKGFIVVKAGDLSESFGDKASFESWICIVWVLNFEYSFGSNA